MRGHLVRLLDHLCGVQQRLGWDAADVEAHAAKHRPAFDDNDLLAEIGGAERGGVAAAAGADHKHFGMHVAPRRRGRSRGGGGVRHRERRDGFLLSAGGQLQDQTALRDAVADLDGDFRDRAGGGRGDVHRRLVALQRDQRLFRGDGIARLHLYFDHRDVLEVPDVGDGDFNRHRRLPSEHDAAHVFQDVAQVADHQAVNSLGSSRSSSNEVIRSSGLLRRISAPSSSAIE